jgi:16S rRNA processing protein RimM
LKSESNSPIHESTNSPTTPGDALLVGRVARAHGNRGEVVVNLETDFPQDRFAAGRDVIVERSGRAERRRITAARFQRGRPVIALEGVETMNDAEALAGAELKIDAGEAGALPANTFYRHDLVGCEVRDRSNRVIGPVSGVEGPMERSLLAVATAKGEVLIPLAAEICVRIDPAARIIVIDPPGGLLELNERERTSGSE